MLEIGKPHGNDFKVNTHFSPFAPGIPSNVEAFYPPAWLLTFYGKPTGQGPPNSVVFNPSDALEKVKRSLKAPGLSTFKATGRAKPN